MSRELESESFVSQAGKAGKTVLCIVAAHLLPIFDSKPLPRTLNYTAALDSFKAFYLNTYIDYHAYETLA